MNMDMILRILGGVLGAQVLLAAITWWPSGGSDSEPRDLVPVNASELSKITIHPRPGGDDSEPLVFEKKSGEWSIATMFDYPASSTEMETLFETIDKLEVRAPVATNEYSHTQLDVADDTFSRKLELTSVEGDTTVVYIGSSQGRAANVRVEGRDEVYRVRGINSAIPERATRYFDRDFQQVDPDSVRRMTIARPDGTNIRFVREGDAWTLPDLTPEGKVVDQARARTFVETTLRLRMLEPAGTSIMPAMGLDQGVKVTWTEEQDDGASVAGEYMVGAVIPGDQTDRVYLKSTTSPYVFVGLKGQLQHALDRAVDDLFVDPPPPVPTDDP